MNASAKSSITAFASERLKTWVNGWTTAPSAEGLNDVLRYLAKWRSQMLANTYVQRQGVQVMQGPFAGMTYLAASTEGALIARLLGCYEAELHPHLIAIVESGVD